MTTTPTRIPADVDREDRMVANLTARQLLLLTITGIVLYAAWAVTRSVLPLAVFAVFAVPVGAAAAILVLGQRDGISLDRLVVAAIRQRLQPRYRVTAPEGVRPAPPWLASQVTHDRHGSRPAGRHGGAVVDSVADIAPAALRLPAEGVSDSGGQIGMVDLGGDGLAVVAVASTVNFALRTPAEQDALVASFGRYLHSLTAPIQVLIRTERLDLSGQIAELRESAGGLPHPALEAAAYEHADYLAQLGEQTDLLRRQVLLVLREPVRAAGPTDGLGGSSPLAWMIAKRAAATQGGVVDDATRRAAATRLVRRLAEAIDLLAPAGIAVTALDAGQATAVLAAACNPDSLIPPSAGLAGADEVITTASAESWDGSPVSGWGFGGDTGQAASPRMSRHTARPLVTSTVTGGDNGDTEDHVNDGFDDSVDDFGYSEDDEDFEGEYAA